MRVHLNVKESHNWQVALEHGQNWKKEIKLQQKKQAGQIQIAHGN
jgi:hypothetical protein